jgi:8-oxo-dGTP pyrophosphatase MutT (NUDIX family)
MDRRHPQPVIRHPFMRERYKTARCILYRDATFLLAVHNSFWRQGDRRWGLPGGQIEWREAPERAARRELEEELGIQVTDLHEIGAFSYKRALHIVYAAPFQDDIPHYDEMELLEIGWFNEAAITELKTAGRLHANYELEAVQTLQRLLGADRLKAGTRGLPYREKDPGVPPRKHLPPAF